MGDFNKTGWEDLAPCQKKEWKALYRTAFPKAERAPLWRLIRGNAKKMCAMEAIFRGDLFAGLTVVIEREAFTYLFFLAVEENMRGAGCGGEILKRLSSGCGAKPLILDMERVEPSPNYDQRIKRKTFYERNGFRSAEFYYEYDGVRYETMFCGNAFPTEPYWNYLPERFRTFRN